MTDLDAIRERHHPVTVRAGIVICNTGDGPDWPCDAAQAIARVAELEAALRLTIRTWLAANEAEAGRGHEGPHDTELQMGEASLLPSDDCLACGGARYGTEDALRTAMIDASRLTGVPDDAPQWFILARPEPKP